MFAVTLRLPGEVPTAALAPLRRLTGLGLAGTRDAVRAGWRIEKFTNAWYDGSAAELLEILDTLAAAGVPVELTDEVPGRAPQPLTLAVLRAEIEAAAS